MRAILAATLLCVLRSGLIHGAIMKKVPGLGYIYNSSWPQTRRPTTEPSGEFDPNLSIQQLMNAEKRYHAIRIPEKIYMQVKYNIYNETEPPWMVKFMADAQRIVDLRKNTTMYFDFSTGKPKNNTYVPKRVFHRRRNYFLHGPPTTYDPNLPELYWTHYLKDFEPNSRGEIIVGGWKKKEVITRGPKRVDLRLKGARAQLAEGDIWGIYAHLLTPTRKIKWTPNIMKPDFNFDHQVMFDPTEANTFWILPATKSWELFDIQDPYHTTRPPQMFIPAWLRGEGLDPQKKGRGGLYNIGGTAYREWEVPVKYRSLSPELVSKYYMMFDDKGRRIAFNRTLPAKWGTVPYGKTFTYRLDITNDDGSINKTIWKRNAGYVTKPDGSLLMVKDLRPEEKLRYLGPEATPRELATRRVNCTHADGSFNYSTIEHETIKTVTYPTAWLNFTNANGSYMRLWKYVKPAITTKYFIKKTTNPVDEPTETVRFTHPNGSLHKVFWKFARYTTPPSNITRETTPSDQAYAFAKKAAPHKEFEIITYPDGGFNYTTQYSPSIINRTAPDGSILFSYFYVPKYLRANASSTVDYKLITNRYGEVIKVVTYRPKLFHLVTNDDGSLNYSEKVANFDQLKAAHYGANFYTVNHLFSNGSVERTNFVHAEEFTTPPPRKYYGYAQTKILNFTRDDGAVLGTFWKIVKNMGAYAGTGSTMMYTFKNKRGGVAHSFWREVPKFTNRDDLIKDDDVTEIRYVTRRDGFLYGSFKKKLRLYTTPVFRPYTGNMSTRVGYFTYPNGTVYGSHWQVDKNTTNPFNATRNPFFRSVIYNAITRPNYIDRVVYHTDYQGQVRYSYKKRFTFAGRSTPTQFQYTGRRLTRLLKFTDTMGKVYGSHWVFDDLRRPTTVAPVTVPNTTRRNPYFTYKGPRPTRIVNYTNAKGERLASFWLFVTDPFDLLNRSTTTLPPLVTPNKHYNAFYFDPGYVSTVEPPRTHSEYARLKDIEVETELPFSTYGPNETRATELTARSTQHDEQSTSQLSRVEGSDASTTHNVEVDLTVKSTLAEETIVPTTAAVTGGDETAKETTSGEEAVTEAITKLTEIVTTTSGPTTEPDVQYVSDSTQEETPAMVKEGPYFPGRDRERRAVKSNQNNPHLRLRKRSVHIMGNNPSPIVRDSEGREGREGRVHNIAERRSNAAFFRRAYSGGKVACDRFRRDAEDVDLIGRDLFDQQQESGGPEGPGGGLFDSFDLPNVQRAKKGKEAVDEKLIEDVTFKDDEDDVKATAVDADDEIDEGAVDGGDRSGDDTSSSDDVDNARRAPPTTPEVRKSAHFVPTRTPHTNRSKYSIENSEWYKGSNQSYVEEWSCLYRPNLEDRDVDQLTYNEMNFRRRYDNGTVPTRDMQEFDEYIYQMKKNVIRRIDKCKEGDTIWPHLTLSQEKKRKLARLRADYVDHLHHMRQAEREEKIIEKDIEYHDLMMNTRRMAKYNTTYLPWELRTTVNQGFVDRINRPLYEKFVRERPSYMRGLPNKYGITMPGDERLASQEFDETQSLTSDEFERYRQEYNMSLKGLRKQRPQIYDELVPKHMRRIRKFKKDNATHANASIVHGVQDTPTHHTGGSEHQSPNGREKRHIVEQEKPKPNLIIYPREYLDYLTDKLSEVVSDVEKKRHSNDWNIDEAGELNSDSYAEYDDSDQYDISSKENIEEIYHTDNENIRCMNNSRTEEISHENSLSEHHESCTTVKNEPTICEDMSNIASKEKEKEDTKTQNIPITKTDHFLEEKSKSNEQIREYYIDFHFTENINQVKNTSRPLSISNESINYLDGMYNENTLRDEVITLTNNNHTKSNIPNVRCKRQVIVMGNDTGGNVKNIGKILAGDMGENEVLNWNSTVVRDYLRFRIKMHEQELMNNASLMFADKLKKLKEQEKQKTERAQSKTEQSSVNDIITERKSNKTKRSVNCNANQSYKNESNEYIQYRRIKRNLDEMYSNLDSREPQINETSQQEKFLHRVEKTAEVLNITEDENLVNLSRNNEEGMIEKVKRDLDKQGYNRDKLDIFQRAKGRRDALRHLKHNLKEEQVADLLDKIKNRFSGNDTKTGNATHARKKSLAETLNLKFNEKNQLILNTEERKEYDLISKMTDAPPIFTVTIKRRKRLAMIFEYEKGDDFLKFQEKAREHAKAREEAEQKEETHKIFNKLNESETIGYGENLFKMMEEELGHPLPTLFTTEAHVSEKRKRKRCAVNEVKKTKWRPFHNDMRKNLHIFNDDIVLDHFKNNDAMKLSKKYQEEYGQFINNQTEMNSPLSRYKRNIVYFGKEGGSQELEVLKSLHKDNKNVINKTDNNVVRIDKDAFMQYFAIKYPQILGMNTTTPSKSVLDQLKRAIIANSSLIHRKGQELKKSYLHELKVVYKKTNQSKVVIDTYTRNRREVKVIEDREMNNVNEKCTPLAPTESEFGDAIQFKNKLNTSKSENEFQDKVAIVDRVKRQIGINKKKNNSNYHAYKAKYLQNSPEHPFHEMDIFNFMDAMKDAKKGDQDQNENFKPRNRRRRKRQILYVAGRNKPFKNDTDIRLLLKDRYGYLGNDAIAKTNVDDWMDVIKLKNATGILKHDLYMDDRDKNKMRKRSVKNDEDYDDIFVDDVGERETNINYLKRIDMRHKHSVYQALNNDIVHIYLNSYKLKGNENKNKQSPSSFFSPNKLNFVQVLNQGHVKNKVSRVRRNLNKLDAENFDDMFIAQNPSGDNGILRDIFKGSKTINQEEKKNMFGDTGKNEEFSKLRENIEKGDLFKDHFGYMCYTKEECTTSKPQTTTVKRFNINELFREKREVVNEKIVVHDRKNRIRRAYESYRERQRRKEKIKKAAEEKINKRILENDQLLFKLKDRLKNKGKKLKALKMKRDLRKFESSDDINREYNDKVDIGRGNVKCKAGVRKKRHVFLLEPSNEQGMKKSSAEIRKLREVMGEDYDKGLFKRCNRKNVVDMIQNRRAIDSSGNVDPEGFKTLTPSKTAATAALQKPGDDYEDREAERDNMEELMQAELKKAKQMTTKNPAMDALKQFYLRSLTGNENKNKRKKRNLSNSKKMSVYNLESIINKDQSLNRLKREIAQSDIKQNDVLSFRHKYSGGPIQDVIKDTSVNSHQESIKGHAIKHRAKRQENRTKSWASCFKDSIDLDASPPSHITINMFTHPPYSESNSNEPMFDLDSDISKYDFIPTPLRTTRITTRRIRNGTHRYVDQRSNFSRIRNKRMVTSSELVDASSHDDSRDKNTLRDNLDGDDDYDVEDLDADPTNRTAVKIRVKRQFLKYSCQREYLSQFPEPSGSYFVRQKAVRKAQKSRMFFKNMSRAGMNSLADKDTSELNRKINDGFQNINSDDARYVYMGHSPFSTKYIDELREPTKRCTTSSVVGNERKCSVHDVNTEENSILHSKTEETSITSTTIDLKTEVSSTTLDVKNQESSTVSNVEKNEKEKTKVVLQTLDLPSQIIKFGIDENRTPLLREIGDDLKDQMKGMCYANPEFMSTQVPPIVMKDGDVFIDNKGHFPSTLIFMDKTTEKIEEESFLKNELENMATRNIKDLLQKTSTKKYKYIDEKYKIIDNGYQNQSFLRKQKKEPGPHSPEQYFRDELSPFRVPRLYNSEYDAVSEWRTCQKSYLFNTASLPLKKSTQTFSYRKSGKESLRPQDKMMDPLPLQVLMHVFPPYVFEINSTNIANEPVTQYQRFKNIEELEKFTDRRKIISMRDLKLKHVTRWIFNGTNKSRYINENFLFENRTVYKTSDIIETIDDESKKLKKLEDYISKMKAPKTRKYNVITLTTQTNIVTKKYKVTRFIFLNKTIDKKMKDFSRKYVFHENPDTSPWMKIRPRILTNKYKFYINSTSQNIKTTQNNKHISLDNSIKNDENWKKTKAESLQQEKEKILKELNIKSDTLKCHNFSLYDLQLLKQLRQNKENSKKMSSFENQILEFFNRPELRAQKSEELTTTKKPTTFHITDDDDEYINDETTTHVDTEERNIRYDVVQDEVDPHEPSEKKYSRKENREEFIKLIKQKLHKEQNQKRNSLERSMIKNFDGNMVEKSSINNGQISEKIVHNSREKREINPNVGENYHQNIRKQYTGGVLENSKIITDKIKNVDTYNYNTKNTILGQLANIVIKRINNKVRNKRSRLTSQKNIESSILEPLNTKKKFAKQKRSLAKDLSLRAKELFETFETINPYNKRKRKLNESQSAKWSISESNDSSSIESEDSLRSWVVPEPFDTFKQTFPSGSVLDPAEFSTRGSTSGVTWGVKEFDNFEAYDISKKMGKTRKPFHINYFDEEMRREDELIRKGLLSTTTYKTPQPIDKNEYYSFSDDKSRELCRVFVTSDVVSNIMEKYKLTSTRSLKELLRFTYFYNIYKKNQTKPSPKTTKAFRWEYVKINVNKDGESIKRDKREVVAVKPNQKNIVFDPNRSFEEVNPNLFLRTEPQTVKQGIRNMHTVYIPRKSTKRDGIKRISFGNLIVLSKYRKNAKYYQYRNVITTRRNFKQHFLNLLDKSHNKRRNVLVVPKNVKTIETRKGIRILNEYLIVREKTTTPFIKNRFKNQSVGFDLSAAHGENLQKLEDCEMFKKFVEGNENVNTAKPRSLKDMILNKTEDEILWQGWLKARENESFMDTEDKGRFKRDIDDEESQMNFNQKRQYKGFVHRLSTKKSTHARNYSAYLKNLIDSPYNELLNKKTQYEGKQKQESQNDYEEYQKLYNAKRAERQNKVKYFSPGEKADENYIARMAPNHKAVYDQGRNFYKNQRQQTQPERRPVDRFLKIYTEVEVHNPYYSNLNIYNEAEWKRYDVVVDDSRINDRFIEEEIEKRPTVKPLLITQVFQSNRYSKLLHKKDNRMKRALKRRRDLSNWNIIEHTAPSDPPDDNFDFNTITPFPTEKPKRPGKTPYADSAIFNDPDSDTEENRQRFETDMRDFFGSDIETMTEIELEKKRIRENFIKQLEEKERKEKEQKEKETDAAKQTNDPQEKHMQKNEHLNNPANHPRKQRSVFLKKLEGELSNPQRKQNSILIEKVEHALKFKRDLSNWNIIEHTAPSDPPDDNFDFNTITPFPTEKPKRPGKTPYADSAIFNDPDSDTEENRQRFETDMRDFFASDIETMTEIELEKKRIRENFIKQLEEKERKEKEQKEKETEVAKHTNAHMQENEHLNNPANHPRKQRSVLLKNLKGELSNTQRKQRSILIKKVEHALKFKRDLSNWNIIEHTAPSDPPDDNFDFNTITPFPTEKPKRPGKTPYADSAIFNDPDSDTEENRQRFETDMRDFFASDIETMTEIELEKKRIRENFIKQLEEKERKEKEQKEKETDLAKQLEVKENNEKEKKEKEQKENIHKKNEEAKTLHRQKRNHGKPVDYIRQRYSGGVVDIIGESKTLKNNGNIDDGNDLKELGNQKLQEDEQRIRAIYDEIDSSKQYVHQTKMKELTPTKDPLVHGQYLNFYQHMLKYSSSQFDQLVKMKAKVVKRQKRDENLKNNEGDTKTITTESYKGKFIPLNRVKRISDALFEVRKEYNITFATPNEKDITLIRTPARRRKRCLVTNDFENNNNGKLNKNEEPIVDRKLVSENSRRRRFLDQLSELKDQVEVFDNNITKLNEGKRIHKRSLRKFYMDNVDDLNNQAEQFYNNLTKDEAYLNRMRKEFNDEFHEANVSKDELLADMVMRQDYNNPNLDAIIDAAYPNEGDRAFLKQPINRFDPAKFLDPNNVENFRQVLEGNPPANEKDENEDHNNMKVHGNRVRRFYMSSAERERLDAWNLYYNITGDETMMNNLREQWKKANTTGPIQHSVMRRHIANEGPKDNFETILGNLNNPARGNKSNACAPSRKRRNINKEPEETVQPNINKGLEETVRPRKTTRRWPSTTLNLTVQAAIKRAKKEARKEGLMLEKWEQANKRDLVEFEHFDEYPHEPFYIQKTTTEPVTVLSWEATETGEEVLGYDSYENLTLQDRFDEVNKSGELFYRIKGLSTVTVDLHVDRFQSFGPPVGPDGRFEDNWFQKLPDGRTFDRPVNLDFSSTTPEPEFYHKTEISLEELRQLREMYEQIPHMRKELVERVQGNEALLNPDMSAQDSKLLDTWQTTMRSGEIFYICATTIPNHRIPESIEAFRPDVLRNGEFEKNWFQLVDGKTYKRPVDLAAYYSLPSTKQVLTRTTKLVRVITDHQMAPEVYDEKAERFAKLMGYDDVEHDEKEKGQTGQKNDVEKERGEKKREHKKKSRRRREADCRRENVSDVGVKIVHDRDVGNENIGRNVILNDGIGNNFSVSDDISRNYVRNENIGRNISLSDDIDRNNSSVSDGICKSVCVSDEIDMNKVAVNEDTGGNYVGISDDNDGNKVSLSNEIGRNKINVSDDFDKNNVSVSYNFDRNNFSVSDNTIRNNIRVSDDFDRNNIIISDNGLDKNNFSVRNDIDRQNGDEGAREIDRKFTTMVGGPNYTRVKSSGYKSHRLVFHFEDLIRLNSNSSNEYEIKPTTQRSNQTIYGKNVDQFGSDNIDWYKEIKNDSLKENVVKTSENPLRIVIEIPVKHIKQSDARFQTNMSNIRRIQIDVLIRKDNAKFDFTNNTSNATPIFNKTANATTDDTTTKLHFQSKLIFSTVNKYDGNISNTFDLIKNASTNQEIPKSYESFVATKDHLDRNTLLKTRSKKQDVQNLLTKVVDFYMHYPKQLNVLHNKMKRHVHNNPKDANEKEMDSIDKPCIQKVNCGKFYKFLKMVHVNVSNTERGKEHEKTKDNIENNEITTRFSLGNCKKYFLLPLDYDYNRLVN